MTELQTTNRVKLSKVRESTFGVTPSNPAFKTQRQTSSSLAFNPQTVTSNEIRSDRQVVDLILVGYQAGGDVGHEMSFGAVDDDLEEAVQGTWSLKPIRDNDGTSDSVITQVTASSDTYTCTDTGADFVAGMLVLASGFTNSGNNSLFKAQAGSSGTAVVAPSSPSLTDEAAPPGTAKVRAVGFEGASGDLVAVTEGGNALTSTSLDFTTLGLSVGEWLKIGGASSGTYLATAEDNGWVRVSAIAANRLSFDRVPTGWTADAGTSKTLQVYWGDRLVNGVTKRSNTFERQYLDHSPVTYEYLTGMTADQLAVNAPAQAIATYSVTYIGAGGTPQASRVSGATDIAAPTNAVLNTSVDVGRIAFDGSDITGPNYVMSAAFTINNNLRRQNAVGHIAAVGTGNGEFTVTGTLETYFGDKSVLDKLMNNTLTSFDMRLGRTDGNREKLVFDFPSIKLSSGSPTVSGKNTDVMLSAGFTAFRDATLGYTMSVGRFHYLPN